MANEMTEWLLKDGTPVTHFGTGITIASGTTVTYTMVDKVCPKQGTNGHWWGIASHISTCFDGNDPGPVTYDKDTDPAKPKPKIKATYTPYTDEANGGVGTMSEHQFADEYGIDIGLNLGKECAKFYVLEKMWSDLHPWDGDTRIERGLFPVDYGMGTRREHRAYDVDRSLKDYGTKLADNFVKYILLACGGEVRYLQQYMSRQQVYLDYKQTPLEWFKYKTKARRQLTATRRSMLIGYINSDGSNLDDVADGAEIRPYEPPFAVRELMDAFDWEADGKATRSAAWREWAGIVGSGTEEALRQCVEAFNHPIWMGNTGNAMFYWKDTGKPVFDLMSKVSVGGPSWAQAAELAADYLSKRIQTRTFLDRCWSLQHNNGSLFNKIYETRSLMRVLQQQAEDNYPLLATHVDDHVRRLWIEHEYSPGGDWPVYGVSLKGVDLGVVSKETAAKLVEAGHNPEKFCVWCALHFETTGDADPCRQGGNCCYASATYGYNLDGSGTPTDGQYVKGQGTYCDDCEEFDCGKCFDCGYHDCECENAGEYSGCGIEDCTECG